MSVSRPLSIPDRACRLCRLATTAAIGSVFSGETSPWHLTAAIDFIADIQHDSPEISDNLVAGFLLAIDDWRKYHVNQILELDRVEAQVYDKV